MSRLTYYLTEGRSKSIDETEAFALIKKNCKKSINSSPIWRGHREIEGEFYYFKPSTEERRSPYAINNVYNLLLSNLPSWKSYPKRNMSIICSSDYDYASNYTDYGAVYRVFPYDGARIGVCSKNDIWNSFRTVGLDPLDDLNIAIKKLLKVSIGLYLEQDTDITYAELVDAFDRVDKIKASVEETVDDDSEPMTGLEYLRDLLFEYTFDRRMWEKTIPYLNDKDTKLIDILNDILNPRRNGFRVVTAGSDLPDDRELWFSDEAVLVHARVPLPVTLFK